MTTETPSRKMNLKKIFGKLNGKVKRKYCQQKSITANTAACVYFSA
jgi:hypothetical protein